MIIRMPLKVFWCGGLLWRGVWGEGISTLKIRKKARFWGEFLSFYVIDLELVKRKIVIL
jgi:hypothetical protein